LIGFPFLQFNVLFLNKRRIQKAALTKYFSSQTRRLSNVSAPRRGVLLKGGA